MLFFPLALLLERYIYITFFCTIIFAERLPWLVWKPGCQIWTKSSSDWPQMGKIRHFFRVDFSSFWLGEPKCSGIWPERVCRDSIPEMNCRKQTKLKSSVNFIEPMWHLCLWFVLFRPVRPLLGPNSGEMSSLRSKNFLCKSYVKNPPKTQF